jgi:hypothetical protein
VVTDWSQAKSVNVGRWTGCLILHLAADIAGASDGGLMRVEMLCETLATIPV